MDAISRKRPVFGTASLVFTALVVVVPVLVVMFFSAVDRVKGHTGWEAFVEVVLAFLLAGLGILLAAVGGVVTGIIGLARGERSRWRAVLGLVLTAPILAYITWFYLTVKSAQ